MEDQEREQLAASIADRLEGCRLVEGAALLDLMRIEQNLQDALQTVRRLTAGHVRAVTTQQEG